MKILAALLVLMTAGLATCGASLFGRLFGKKSPVAQVGLANLGALDNYLSNKIPSDQVEEITKLLERNINKINDVDVRSTGLLVLQLAHSNGRCDDSLLEALDKASYAGAKLTGLRRVDKVFAYHLPGAISACQEYIKQRIEQVLSSSSQVAKLVALSNKRGPSIYSQDPFNLLDIFHVIQGMKDPDVNYYELVGGQYNFEHDKFDRARNKFLMPACRELLDHMRLLYVGVTAIKTIMKEAQPGPLSEARFKHLNEVLWTDNLCRYAERWDSSDTTRLIEQLNTRWSHYEANTTDE